MPSVLLGAAPAKRLALALKRAPRMHLIGSATGVLLAAGCCLYGLADPHGAWAMASSAIPPRCAWDALSKHHTRHTGLNTHRDRSRSGQGSIHEAGMRLLVQTLNQAEPAQRAAQRAAATAATFACFCRHCFQEGRQDLQVNESRVIERYGSLIREKALAKLGHESGLEKQ